MSVTVSSIEQQALDMYKNLANSFFDSGKKVNNKILELYEALNEFIKSNNLVSANKQRFEEFLTTIEPAIHHFKTQTMVLRAQIEAYQPIDEQETRDKDTILQYIRDFPDILCRENVYAHFSSSSWIVNPSRTKILVVWHNIYKTWTWTGGHTDGDVHLLDVALREAEEETGAKCRPLTTDIVSLDILPVWGHVKRGQWVSSHQHLSVCYLFEADDESQLKIKEDENSGVKWIDADIAVEECSRVGPEMRYVYQKLMNRIKDFPPK